MASAAAEMEALLNSRSDAIRAKDIERPMSTSCISTSAGVAATSMLIRAGGTLRSGNEVERWLGTTSSCQRSDHKWLIVHEHVSLPVDFASGRAVMDLVP